MDDQEEASEQLTGVAIESSLAAADEGAPAHAGTERGRLGRWRHWTAPVSQAIAVSALLLGVSNALFAYCQSQDQREHDLRLELRTTIQRLTETQARLLAAKSACIASYDSVCANNAIAVEGEYAALALQAADLTESVDASSAELRSIANAFSQIRDDSRALRFIRRSVERAEDIGERSRSTQVEAAVLFLSKRPDEARKVLSALERDIGRQRFEVEPGRSNLLWLLHFSWLGSEFDYGGCQDVAAVYKRARGALQTLALPAAVAAVAAYPTPAELDSIVLPLWRGKGCTGTP